MQSWELVCGKNSADVGLEKQISKAVYNYAFQPDDRQSKNLALVKRNNNINGGKRSARNNKEKRDAENADFVAKELRQKSIPNAILCMRKENRDIIQQSEDTLTSRYSYREGSARKSVLETIMGAGSVPNNNVRNSPGKTKALKK